MFARRQRRTLGVAELDELMLRGPGRRLRRRPRPGDRATRTCGSLKPHYYGSHFYNWPYTYGLLFGLGLFAATATTPSASAPATTTCCRGPAWTPPRSSAPAFGLDVTDEAFWTASLDVLRGRIAEYERLVAERTRRDRRAPPATASTATRSAELLAGEPRYRVDQVWQGLYEQPRPARTR